MFYSHDIFVDSEIESLCLSTEMKPKLKQICTLNEKVRERTWCGICFLCRFLLNLATKAAESSQIPTQSPSRNTLSFPESKVEVSFTNFSIPQASNFWRRGSKTLVLTRPMLAKFFTSPQFSPSGVERKQTLPQCEGCLHPAI